MRGVSARVCTSWKCAAPPAACRCSISRSHPGLVRRLFELEVPEIFDGTVEIHGIAREPAPGARSPSAAPSRTSTPSGACVGPRGARVAGRGQRAGRREDRHNRVQREDPATYIAHALAPAMVLSVTDGVRQQDLPRGSAREPAVPGHRPRGQNARLAAKLTGFKIDIKSDDGMGVAAE